MKVQLRRWFAIGLTSGSLVVSMIAGSAAVGAAGAGTQAVSVTHEQVDAIAMPVADRLYTIVPEGISTLPVLTPDVSTSRDSRS